MIGCLCESCGVQIKKDSFSAIRNMMVDAYNRGYRDGAGNEPKANFSISEEPQACDSVIRLKVMLASFPFMVMRSKNGRLYRFNGDRFQTRHGLGWRMTKQYDEPPYEPYDCSNLEMQDG